MPIVANLTLREQKAAPTAGITHARPLQCLCQNRKLTLSSTPCEHSEEMPKSTVKLRKTGASQATWHGLKILHTEKGKESDERKVTVEFEAQLTTQKGIRDVHQRKLVTFKKVNGTWLYSTAAT